MAEFSTIQNCGFFTAVCGFFHPLPAIFLTWRTDWNSKMAAATGFPVWRGGARGAPEVGRDREHFTPRAPIP